MTHHDDSVKFLEMLAAIDLCRVEVVVTGRALAVAVVLVAGWHGLAAADKVVRTPGTVVFSDEPIEHDHEDPAKLAREFAVGSSLYGRAYLKPNHSKTLTITRYLDGAKYFETVSDVPADWATMNITLMNKTWGADDKPHKIRVVVRNEDGTEVASGECTHGVSAPPGSADARCGEQLKPCIFEDAYAECAPFWFDCLRGTDDYTRTCKARKASTTVFATAKRKGYTLELSCNGDLLVKRPSDDGGGEYAVKAVSSKRMAQLLECGMCQSNEDRCLKSAMTRPEQQACDAELAKCRGKQRCDRPVR